MLISGRLTISGERNRMCTVCPSVLGCWQHLERVVPHAAILILAMLCLTGCGSRGAEGHLLSLRIPHRFESLTNEEITLTVSSKVGQGIPREKRLRLFLNQERIFKGDVSAPLDIPPCALAGRMRLASGVYEFRVIDDTETQQVAVVFDSTNVTDIMISLVPFRVTATNASNVIYRL